MIKRKTLNLVDSSSYFMTLIGRSMEINAPISEVFTYFARPEHMADQFPEEMRLQVLPIKVKDNFGVGTIFRIIGDFNGKQLEWDCETVEFEEVGEGKSKTGINVDYEMPFGPFGGLMDKVKLKKSAERGIENGLYRVKALLEGTGSIPVYITLDAYRALLQEKELMKCNTSEAIVKLINSKTAVAKQ